MGIGQLQCDFGGPCADFTIETNGARFKEVLLLKGFTRDISVPRPFP
jgi:hypothetical protein